MSLEDAQREAVRRGVAALQSVDLEERCRAIGLPAPGGTALRFRAFGQDFILELPGLGLARADTGEPAKPKDQILVLHYLGCQRTIQPTGELINFRDMPGGRFYWQAFRGRSLAPLIQRIGNHTEVLLHNLGRFDWQPFGSGDVGARIHAIGRLEAFLIYHRGDEECGPDADLLFDACIKHAYASEDVAALASRVCLGLL
jgi:hypothetical protein